MAQDDDDDDDGDEDAEGGAHKGPTKGHKAEVGPARGRGCLGIVNGGKQDGALLHNTSPRVVQSVVTSLEYVAVGLIGLVGLGAS